jgi:hypothetical protein
MERAAIKYGCSLIQTPKGGQSEPLSKIEREAIDYLKAYLVNLSSSRLI